jgi:hypothetical protein
MQWKAVGVVSVLVAYVGCGAAPDDAAGNDDVEAVTSAATACASYTGTVQQHLAAGRVTRYDTPFFIWTFTSYSTSGANPEVIGSSATQVVTLYATAGGYTQTASKCQAATCGNGTVESPAEDCDGTAFGGGGEAPQCTEFGADPAWGSGTVKCGADCKFDKSPCKVAVCGDGIVAGNERCDGPLTGNTDCTRYTDQGIFVGGTLKCSNTCTIDVSGCTTLCGNGVIDPGEDCEGTHFSAAYAGKTCADFQVPEPTWPFGFRIPYSAGTFTCADCRVSLPLQCRIPTGCYYGFVAGSQPSSGVVCH